MPAFNTAPYIRASIESALRQEEVRLELVVVDDGSDDDTYEVAKSIRDGRVRVLRNPENKGISFCHNRVIDNSRAPYIVQLDSDDFIIRPYAFRKLLDLIQTSEDIALVHAHYIYVDRDGQASWPAMREIRNLHVRTRVPGRDYREALLNEGTVMNHLRMFRRSSLDFLGPFNESMRCGEDLEMAMRLVEHFRIEVVPEALLAVRVREDSASKLYFRRFKSLRYVWQRMIIADRLSRSGQISYAERRFLNMLVGLAKIPVRKLRNLVN